MNAQSLNARLTPLFESLKQTQQLITRLSKFAAPAGSTPSNPEESSDGARVELSTEIHQSLKEQEEDFELLRQEVEDYTNTSNWGTSARRRGGEQEREREKTDLAAQVTRLGEDLKIARAQFRKAQLQAKRNANSQKRKERELLFSNLQDGSAPTPSSTRSRKPNQQDTKLSQEEILANASHDVTAALRRTHNLMTAELERSRFAQETLENSTRELESLSESYSNLDSLLSRSRSLVGTLIHSQKSDTWYLESAFLILSITIGWLLFRRLVYGPGWWLVYFPLKWIWRLCFLPIQLFIGALSTAGAKNQSIAVSQSSVSVSSSLAQAATGRAGIPRIQPGQQAPSVMVGAGGYGAKMQAPSQQQGGALQEGKEGETLSEQVGAMAEGKREQGQRWSGDDTGREKQEEQQGTVLRERTDEDGPPNPKKRMWEEPVDADGGGRARDEL
ncbi:Protein transport protein sec20 [Lecanora helva]